MPHRIPFRLLGAAALTVAVGAACGGSSTPDPSPSPAVSAVPSSVVIDLGAADRLYVDGDSEGAVRIYSAAVLRGTREQQQHGLWALARIEYEQGNQGKAAQNTAALLATEPKDKERERRAYLLLGYAEQAQGHRKEAKEALEKYVELGGPAIPYAQIKLAEIAAADGDPAEAAHVAQEALGAELPPAQETAFMFSLARYQEDAKDTEGALATLQSLADGGATASDSAEALWETARIASDKGDSQRRQDALRTLIVSYPDSDRALEALVPSEQTTIAERALVLFRHRENEAAKQAYLGLVADPDPNVVGEAHYRLGILGERAVDPGTALNEYGAAIEVLTPIGGALLDDAYWDRGLVLEAAGRLDEAVASYVTVADLQSTEFSGDALMRAGMIRYKQVSPGVAAMIWERRLGLSLDQAEKARTNFWLARAHGDMGDGVQRQAHLAAAAGTQGYYGLRAAAMLAGEQPNTDPPDVSPLVADWAEVERWLTALVGPEATPTSTTTPGPSIEAATAWQRAEEVLEAGLTSQAIDEIRYVLSKERSAWAIYRIARRLSEEGYVRSAALAASSLLGYQNPPRTLLALSYPAKYLSQINAAAHAEGISPVLLLALVRQESFFDAGAVSEAGAFGLTQVVPDTGRQIAAELRVTDFNEGELLKPETSLRFGAHYIAAQLQGFGGKVGPALAAYNGGPGNAARWSEASSGDADLLVETIDFDETRRYVELVQESYAFYGYVYGVRDKLALPLR